MQRRFVFSAALVLSLMLSVSAAYASIYRSDHAYAVPSVLGEFNFDEVGQEGVPMAAEPEGVDESAVVEDDDGIPRESRKWTLIWSDEFDGEAGTPINAEFWTHDTGGHGWGNNELEYYTDRVANASLDGSGHLAIVARQETLEGYDCDYGPCQYTSARILSQAKVEFTYGRVEARIRIPRGQGIWPAFWMLGANLDRVSWPNCGEIDVMENIGREPRTVYGTIHGPGYSGTNGIGSSYHIDEDFADDFHVYTIVWEANVIRWYVDGELYNTVSADDLNGRAWVYDHDFFIILNVAVGGGWPGSPDETTEFPQTMLVDYVRVYQVAEPPAE
jgi:beta-glucanase (GH16 family)